MSSSTAIVLVGLAAVAVLALSNSRAPAPPPAPQPQPQMNPLVNEKQDNTARDWAAGIKAGADAAAKIADALRKWI